MDLRHADDDGVERARLARRNRLEGRHDLGCAHHGVGAALRHGGMRAEAAHDEVELVGRGHHRAGAHRETARLGARPIMHAVHAFDREFLEQPFFDHEIAPAAALFGGLEDELHRSDEILGLGEIFGGPQQHRRSLIP